MILMNGGTSAHVSLNTTRNLWIDIHDWIGMIGRPNEDRKKVRKKGLER